MFPGAPAEPAIPTLTQLQRAALEVIDDVGYGPDLQADVRGFVNVRLRSLRVGAAGRFFEGGHPADIGELLRRSVVLAIEDVANDEDKAFLMGTLIIRLVEHLRLRARRERPGGLRHVIVIEEAHRLLRNRGEERAGAHAVELFAGMLAEIRAYGEGMVVAEQIPAKLVPDVVKNTALKIVHRLPAADDRQVVGAAMNLDDEQSRQVVSLQPGVAAVFADGMDRPLRIRVPAGRGQGARRSQQPGAAAVRPAQCRLRPGLRGGARMHPGRAAPRRAAGRRGRPGLAAGLDGDAGARVLDRPRAARGSGRPAAPVVRAGCQAARVRARRADRQVGRCPGGQRARQLRPGPAGGERLVGGAARADGANAARHQGRSGWVAGPLRWLHEVERICPLGGPRPDPCDPAPPPDFDLAGGAARPAIRVGQRMRELRRHPLAMELEPNRRVAWNLLFGDDDQRGFLADLAAVMVGREPGLQLARGRGGDGCLRLA